MLLNKLSPALLLCFGFAHAAVELVTELSENNSIHTAPVIHKNAIYAELIQHVPKNVCKNIVKSRHFDSRGTIDIVHRNNQVCREEMHRKIFKVLKGYEVIYSYNGVLMNAFFDHDPGNFVSVRAGH